MYDMYIYIYVCNCIYVYVYLSPFLSRGQKSLLRCEDCHEDWPNHSINLSQCRLAMVALRANRHSIVGLVAEILESKDVMDRIKWTGTLWSLGVSTASVSVGALRDDVCTFWIVN